MEQINTKIIFYLSSLVLWLLTFLYHNPSIQPLVGILYLCFVALLFGYWFYPKQNWFWQIITGLFIVLSTLIISGAALIYTIGLNVQSLQIIFIILNVLPLLFIKNIELNLPKFQLPKLTINTILFTLITVLVIVITYLYFTASTAETIFSPWLILPPYLILLYAICVFALLVYILLSKNRKFVFLTSLVFFVSTSLAVIIYKLGYGFDPFIHEVTANIIQDTGTITPKPLYYLGFYSLIINLKWLTGISIAILNKWLVPVLFSLILPVFIYYIHKINFTEKKNNFRYLPILLLILPFSLFINSTPQALANLLFIILLFWQFISNEYNKYHFTIGTLLTIAILSIHPITGVPAFFLWLFTIFKKYSQTKDVQKIISRLVMIEISILGALAIPALFVLNSYLNDNPISIALNIPELFTQTYQYISFVSFYDFAYLLPLLSKTFILAMAIYGIVYLIQESKINDYSHFIYLYLITLVNFFICKYWLSYNFLISYEQEIYAARIWDLSWYILLPFSFIGAALLIKKIASYPFLHRFFILLLLTSLITSNFYLSYPRRDPYIYNKSINTSSFDFEAVNYISSIAPTDYVVLANQAVSAAAIAEFGFAKYYDDLFYYPLPTSSPLYQSYLDLAYQKKSITAVLNQIVSKTSQADIYFVINDYWTGFEDIVNEHKKNATAWHIIGEENIYIFYYNLNSND